MPGARYGASQADRRPRRKCHARQTANAPPMTAQTVLPRSIETSRGAGTATLPAMAPAAGSTRARSARRPGPGGGKRLGAQAPVRIGVPACFGDQHGRARGRPSSDQAEQRPAIRSRRPIAATLDWHAECRTRRCYTQRRPTPRASPRTSTDGNQAESRAEQRERELRERHQASADEHPQRPVGDRRRAVASAESGRRSATERQPLDADQHQGAEADQVNTHRRPVPHRAEAARRCASSY